MFVKIEFPFYGVLREIIMHGIATLLDPYEGVFDYDPIKGIVLEGDYNHSFEEFLKSKYNKFLEKIGGVRGSKLNKNDRDSYSKNLGFLFGTNIPNTYIDLFLEIINILKDRVGKDPSLDFMKSLSSISIKKNEIILGNKEHAVILVPAILKQAEFYEYGSGFNKPTTGMKINIRMDPIWLTILALGFLSTYAGYFGGYYYIIYFSGIETYFADGDMLNKILRSIDMISNVNIRLKTPYEVAEVFEFSLALALVDLIREQDFDSNELVFPLILTKIGLLGNTYTIKGFIELDLHALIEFIAKYYQNYQAIMHGEIREIKIKFGKNELMFGTPLAALVFLAIKELQVDLGDNELSAYLMIKDLYRAVNSRRRKILEDSLFRILRNSVLLRKRKPKSKIYKYVLEVFSNPKNVQALLDAIESP